MQAYKLIEAFIRDYCGNDIYNFAHVFIKKNKKEHIMEKAIKYVSLDKIIPSETNQRKNFDEDKLHELAESIKDKGVLQPILIRPFNGVDVEGMYEIVAGERRCRAAQMAGMKTVPAIIRILTDDEAVEIQVVENLQRENLSPLEEADGYSVLLKSGRYENVETLALRLGKSKSYIYNRMRLTHLPESIKIALNEKRIPLSSALLIARIPNDKIRDKVAKEIETYSSGNFDEISTVEIKREIKETYRELSSAPFNSADVCVQCPNRSGNEQGLFNDIEDKDICMDPECFQKNIHIAFEEEVKKAEKQGVYVLNDEESEKATRYVYNDEYIKLESRLYAYQVPNPPENIEDMPTVGELVKGSGNIVLAKDFRTGEPTYMILADDIEEAARKNGFDYFDEPELSGEEKEDNEKRNNIWEKRTEERKKREELMDAIFACAIEKSSEAGVAYNLLNLIFYIIIIGCQPFTISKIIDEWGIEVDIKENEDFRKKKEKAVSAIMRFVKKSDNGARQSLLLSVVLNSTFRSQIQTKPVIDLIKDLGVDVDALEKQHGITILENEEA